MLSDQSATGAPGVHPHDILEGREAPLLGVDGGSWQGRGRHKAVGEGHVRETALLIFPSNMAVGEVYEAASDSQCIINTAFGANQPFLSTSV